MHLQLISVVLWSRDESLAPRILKFEPGMVNVIMGLSRTGKSAVIPIIDYCLGAKVCAIPKKVVRSACSWFGIVIETKEGQKLLARKEPGGEEASWDMYVLEGSEVEIPNAITDGNSNPRIVKRKMDELSGLTQLGIGGLDPGDSTDHRPSFRDLMAFVFQPQNVIANRDILFYRTGELIHKMKLSKHVLPYVLGAVTTEVLDAIYKEEELERAIRRKERELQAAQRASTRWEAEISGHLERASELGLIAPDENLDLKPDAMLGLLRKVARKTVDDFRADSSTITRAVEELSRLESEEAELADKIALLKARQEDLNRLREGAGSFQEALRSQRERLEISNWLANEAGHENCPICGNALAAEKEAAEALRRELEEVERQAAQIEHVPVNVDREVLIVRQETDTLFDSLNDLRRQRRALTGTSEEARKRQFKSLNVALFLGQMKQAVALYDDAHEGGELANEINALRQQLGRTTRLIDQALIRQRTEHAVSRISHHIAQFMPVLDNDHPTDRAELVVENLTLRIIGEEGESFLWSIGSGSNHLSYHVATMLALHLYFQSLPKTQVPGLLIIDQPSQVYFPERTSFDPNAKWRDEDCEAVRKIFTLLGKVSELSNGRLQIIVLDHAPEQVWGDLPGVVLSEDWRHTGRKLVPPNWPGAQT